MRSKTAVLVCPDRTLTWCNRPFRFIIYVLMYLSKVKKNEWPNNIISQNRLQLNSNYSKRIFYNKIKKILKLVFILFFYCFLLVFESLFSLMLFSLGKILVFFFFVNKGGEHTPLYPVTFLYW
uniref:Uncharacterized protein n=1 Tax=Cacopsylla melanoneura TaxID=428564 RepID=A0A8D8UD18_9HEMI